jgi:hypothetical protein
METELSGFVVWARHEKAREDLSKKRRWVSSSEADYTHPTLASALLLLGSKGS